MEECICPKFGIMILVLGFPSKLRLLLHRILSALRCPHPQPHSVPRWFEQELGSRGGLVSSF